MIEKIYEDFYMIPMFFSQAPVAMRWIKRLVWFYISIFVVTKVTSVWFASNFIMDFFCLNAAGNFTWEIWRYVTYSFLHANIGHILCNMLLFYTLCRFLLTYELSLKHLLGLYFVGIVIGGLFWVILHVQQAYFILIGASAGTSTLLTYFCLLYPEKSLSVFLFFLFPIQIKAKTCFYFLVAYELISCLFYETQGLSTIAHSAHLGGIIVGALAVYYAKHKEDIGFKKATTNLKKNRYKVHIEEDNIITDVPFEILKKLQNEGLGSLSASEREWLEKYRKL